MPTSFTVDADGVNAEDDCDDRAAKESFGFDFASSAALDAAMITKRMMPMAQFYKAPKRERGKVL